MTLDGAVGGVRNRGAKAGFKFPSTVEWANLGISPSDWAASAGQVSSTVEWDDVKWLCEVSSLPVFIKGVMCGEDAVKGVECGASGIIVSNHGGRQLDEAPSTLSVLGHVCNALRDAGVYDSCDVLIDGGIRRGSDVVKAS